VRGVVEDQLDGSYRVEYIPTQSGQCAMRIAAVRQGGLLAEYYENVWQFYAPVSRRIEAALDHDWGLAKITDAAVDYVSVRWTGLARFFTLSCSFLFLFPPLFLFFSLSLSHTHTIDVSAYVYVKMYVYVNMYTYEYVHVCMCIYIHLYMKIQISIFIHMYIYIYKYTIYIYIYIYVYIYIYIYI